MILPSPETTEELSHLLYLGLDLAKVLTVHRLVTGWTLDLRLLFTGFDLIPLSHAAVAVAVSALQLDFALRPGAFEAGLRGLEGPLADIEEFRSVVGLNDDVLLDTHSADRTGHFC